MAVKKTVLCIGALALGIASNLAAAPIFGAFNFDGSVTVTQNTITWKSNSNVNDKATIGATGLTGSFAGLGGTTISIQDLNRATEPIGVNFAPQLFISFDAAPTYDVLNISFIALGAFPSTQCFSAPAPGQICTLSSADVPGGSPFMFTNTSSNGATVDGSSATWSMRGTTSGGAPWSGVWTAQFLTSYQDVLAAFFAPGGGTITNSYSAAAQVSIVPEPDTTLLLGAGLMAVSFAFRRFRRA